MANIYETKPGSTVLEQITMNQLITTTPHEIAAGNFCGQCGAQVVVNDRFCRQCGTACQEVSIVDAEVVSGHQAVGRPMNAPISNNSAGETLQYVLNNRMMVMGVVALIGPLGLPVLWFSPRFRPVTKIIVTTLYVLLTAIVPVVVTYYVLENSFKPLVDAVGY